MAADRPEIVFFDLETTIPLRVGQKFKVLEFGAILVCPQKLVELKELSTFIRPDDLSLISEASVKCNGISSDEVATAPKFEDVADAIYDFMNGRVWAGHNIVRFDCVRIREAFAEIGRPAPEAKGLIDSLHLLQKKFGRRAGDMKMASLANYFGLGTQKHRSLDDVRLNLEVLKYCATVLFLESNFPDVLSVAISSTPVKSELSDVSTSKSSSTSKSRRKGKTSIEIVSEEKGQKPLQRKSKTSPLNNVVGRLSNNSAKSVNSGADKSPFDLTELREVLEDENQDILSASAEYFKVKQSECTESGDNFELHEESTFAPKVSEDRSLGILPDVSNVMSVSVQCCKAKQSECAKSEIFLDTHQTFTFSTEISEDEDVTILTDPACVASVSAQRCKVEQSECTKSRDFLEPRELSTFSPKVLEDENHGILSGSSVVSFSPDKRCEAKQSDCKESEEFLEPHHISISSLRTIYEPSQWGTQKMMLLHKDLPFRMRSSNMILRYRISRKFFDPTGKPRLSFVVEPSSEICNILKVCDVLAQKSFSSFNDKSEWRPLVKCGLGNAIPAVRIHIATAGSGETSTYSTELYRRDSKGTTQRLAFKTVDINELDELFVYGMLVDADYDFDIYDYQQHAGIRLVARRLSVVC